MATMDPGQRRKASAGAAAIKKNKAFTSAYELRLIDAIKKSKMYTSKSRNQRTQNRAGHWGRPTS